jgi:hypothetical protein
MVTCGGGGQSRHLPFLTNIWKEEIRIEGRMEILKKKLNSVAFSPQANYTDRVTASCRRS